MYDVTVEWAHITANLFCKQAITEGSVPVFKFKKVKRSRTAISTWVDAINLVVINAD